MSTICNISSGLAYGSGLHLLAYSEGGELYTWVSLYINLQLTLLIYITLHPSYLNFFILKGYNTYSQLGNGTTNHTLTPSIGIQFDISIIYLNLCI